MSAAELRRAADQAEAAERGPVLEEVCRQVGIGLREAQSRNRAPAIAAKRAVVAWMLCTRRDWTQRHTAEALQRTERQVRRMIGALR